MIVPLLALPLALSLRATPPIGCGDSGHLNTNINAGQQDYAAVLDVGKKGPTFQLHATFAIKGAFSCGPDVQLAVVGKGAGSHHEHVKSIQDGDSIRLDVNDTATDFDLIFSEIGGFACGYQIQVDYKLVCSPAPPPVPPPPSPPSKLPIWLTWWAKINQTATQPGGHTSVEHGVAAWDTAPGSQVNKTAWSGPNPWVADFNAQTVYYMKTGNVCAYTCQMEGGENSCNSAMDGDAFCGYDYETRGKFIDNVTLPGGREASHYRYSDPLGPISMADHDLYLDRATGTPVRVSASFHPFGVFVANVTADYTEFLTTSPPTSYFEVEQIKFCQPGDSDQCTDSLARSRRQLGMLWPPPKKK